MSPASFEVGGHDRRRLDAALELALDLRVSQTLTRAGLTDREAVELTASLLDAALPPR